MFYALKILWRERIRYLAAMLAVMFSALLIAVQCGLLLGLLMFASLPIDRSSSELWVTTRDAPSMGLGRPVPEKTWLPRLMSQPEIARVEIFLQGAGEWHKPNQASSEHCLLIGTRLDDGSLGAMKALTPELRLLLSEPGAVVIDDSDVTRFGLKHGKDEYAEISGQRVRVVGTVHGFKGVTNPFVFCSLQTCRMLVPQFEQHNEASFFLASCYDADAAPRVARRLNALYPDMRVYTSEDFSILTRSYWLFRSQAGVVMSCTVVLALLVGMVVTSQTLRGAVLAALRELAVLDALGIPRWRLVALVLAQSFWIGLLGIALAFPVMLTVTWVAALVETKVLLPGWLLLMTAGLTMGMALLSGVSVLRTLRRVEPATLLR